ncbi:vimentin-type intermediate filament-associated coiled-coil protein isoform X3 [Mus pahari]|uniref:vimentin-type intermediate filament-associated coiled-coil protein isoform X3 n=1 Tax=Mus pahari TaxID=10093 RepID=UPI000A30731E|nr:vimentin-type intermediate filament-associated coiled-coil protein isoform X3 [Mus pahari]
MEREISALQEQLLSSQATVRSLQAAVNQRDQMIQQLQPRADLLQDITRHRPPLAVLLATLEEAEELGPLPASHSHGAQLLPDGPGPPLGNNMRKEEGQDGQDDQDDQQPAVFGTTV